MPVMTTHTTPSAYEYIDSSVRMFYQEVADDYEPKWDKIFDSLTTDKAWVQDLPMGGLGPMRRNDEGRAVEYDTLYEGTPATYVLTGLHIGFGVTEYAKIFNKLWPLLENGTKSIAVANIHSVEMICADLFNNAFLTTYVGGDGKAMAAADHPLLRPDAAAVSGSATYRNRPAVDYDLSEAGLEQAVIDVMGIVDESGFYGSVTPDSLIIPRQLVFVAERVLKSINRVGTADNDTNALKGLGYLQGRPLVWQYLTNEKAFFIKNKQFTGPGLKCYKHSDVKPTPKTWVDNATGNIYVRAIDFVAPGWSNPRAIYGSPGTAA